MRILLLIGAIVLVALAAIFLLQRRLLYFPETYPAAGALAAAPRLGLAPWRAGPEGVCGWRALRPGAGPARGRVLVLHGNAGSALERLPYAAALGRLGLEVILVEYPGYGACPGAPGMEALTAAAVGAVDAAAAEGGPVYLLGESLGSGVAARAAARRPDAVRGLILVTPFADLAAVARLHYGPVAALLRDRFAPARELAGYRRPVAILVAGRDEVVGAAQGRALLAALPGPKRLSEQPEATHNGLDLSPGLPFWAEAVALLEAGGGAP